MSRIMFLLSTVLIVLSGVLTVSQSRPVKEQLKPVPMPLYQGNLNFPVSSYSPEPHREESVQKWLIPSVRIRMPTCAGSGTICHYDPTKNIAYVISCAHLFEHGDTKAIIEVFYKNEQKLETPQKFAAKVISFKENYYADDISFMTFEPDWTPTTWFPIAAVDRPIINNSVYYSCGCDHAEEVACYYVKPQGIDGAFLATVENSPRPGRSGGGLIDKDGWYVGICVRTSDINGNGTGYFVHLKTIHNYCHTNNLDFLLGKNAPSGLLRSIPIVDRNGPQGEYPLDYVPVP